MGLRQAINEKKGLGPAIAAVFVVLAGVFIYLELRPTPKVNLEQMYYSDDDGQTWFPDSVYHICPFDHNGKEAVIANVYSYDDGSKKFVGYLAKYTDEGKKELEAAIADAEKNGQPPSSAVPYNDHTWNNTRMLIKKPGDKDWVLMTDPKALGIMSVVAPDKTPVDSVLIN